MGITSATLSPMGILAGRPVQIFPVYYVLHQLSLFSTPAIWTTPEHHPAALGHTFGLQVSSVHALHVTFTSFVLQRNTSIRAHIDLNNAPCSCNVVLPCSSFTRRLPLVAIHHWPVAPLSIALCIDPFRTSHCQASPSTHINGTKHALGTRAPCYHCRLHHQRRG